MPLSPYTALSAVSDVGVALGMQIMSNVTTNSTQDAAATRLIAVLCLGHKNFLLLLSLRRKEEGEGKRVICCLTFGIDLLRNPFVIGCRRKQSHIFHHSVDLAYLPPSLPACLALGAFVHAPESWHEAELNCPVSSAVWTAAVASPLPLAPPLAVT